MSEGAELADDYRRSLADLTCNNKNQINMLTILAEDYKDYAANIVEVIEDGLLKNSPEKKIYVLYLIDSIVKNVRDGDYRMLFAKNIVKIFEHVFKESDERTRASLYKLRRTWDDIFPRGKLYAIDTKVSAIDRAWPMPSLNPTSNATASTSVVGSKMLNQTVHVNPKFLKSNNSNVVKEERKNNNSSVSSTTSTAVASSSKDKEAPHHPTIPKKKRRVMPEHASAHPPVKEVAAPPLKPVVQPPMQKTVALGSHAFISAPQPVASSTSFPTPVSSTIAPVSCALPVPFPNVKLEPSFTNVKMEQQSIPVTATAMSMPVTVVQPPVIQTPIVSSTVPTHMSQGVAVGPPVHMPFVPTSSYGGGVPPSQISMMMPLSTATISDGTPRLSGMPANNRVFVDGRSYEVHFINEIPVIVRNGLPHKVSFSGPPRDIIIDGVVHKLAFGESKAFIIDGEQHILRFGAPSRELYMGNYPFRGQFGGPPIIATINGRRHEIRLCGAPPEAKIEQDPCYELVRYIEDILPQQTNNAMLPAPPKAEQPKKDSNLDVTGLLKKLQNSGVFQQLTKAAQETNKPKQAEKSAVAASSTSAMERSTNSPPIPSNQRLDNLERRPAPTSSLEQFSMRSLVIRYDSVIEALHKPRIACPHCEITIKQLYSEPHQKHIDWHLQSDNRNSKDTNNYIRSRPWYMCDEWFTYSEIELVNGTPSADVEKVDDQVASGSGGNTGDTLSEEIGVKECCVCNEKFEEYWDEEDDVWKIRNCIVEDGKVFHRCCKPDAQNNTAENNSESASNSENFQKVNSLFFVYV